MHVLPFELHAIWPPLTMLAQRVAPYLTAIFLLLVTPLAVGPRHLTQAPVTHAVMIGPDGSATPVDLGALTLPNGRGTLRVLVEVPAQMETDTPFAVYLSGLFSADAHWNGAPIGSKGAPGAAPGLETPGPIDVVLPLPPAIFRPGANVLELSLSSWRSQGFGSIMHDVNGRVGISVAPYSADHRRPLGDYAAPLLMIGVFGLALIAIVVNGAPRRLGALLVAAGLLVAASAEITRSLVDYPYPFHWLRVGVLLAGCVAAACGLVLSALEWSDAKQRRSTLLILAALITIALIGLTSFDDRAMYVVVLGAVVGAAIAFKDALERKEGCLSLAIALILIPALAALDPHNFLDRSLYVGALPFLAQTTLRRETSAQTRLPDRIAIGGAGRRRLVLLSQLLAVHGAGNYSEFELLSGERILDDRKLGDLAKMLPQSFLRAHRSHIINLDRASALLTLGGGRYAVEMEGGTRVPLSRSRVGTIRSIFEAGLPASAAGD